MRQAGTWDPLLKCCNACTWTHVSSSNEIPRNCMGLKITACMHLEGKFWRKDAKRPQTLPLLKLWIKRRLSRAEAGYCTCPLHTPPPMRWTKHLSHPLASHHVRNKLGPVLSEREQATEFAVCSCSPFCSRGPNKSVPEKKKWDFF